MSESKLKKPGQIKGADYKKAQREPVGARFVKVAPLSDKWLEKHYPGYIERKRERLAETARKAAEKAAMIKPSAEKENGVEGKELKQAADSGLK